MSEIDARIARLRVAIREQEAQMAWLVSVDWSEKLVGVAYLEQSLDHILSEHGHVISVYETLIRELEISRERAKAGRP